MNEEDVPDRHCRVTSGALSDDVSRAVEIISVRDEVPGSSAYRMLVESAGDARLSVRETARRIVETPRGA